MPGAGTPGVSLKHRQGENLNSLVHERSAYLRHAKDQKIDWRPWSEEAFAEARRQGKPVFLSSGAQWCHWCHVMARESFENDDVAQLLNERYISIKLDRDERPDVDRRYQRAVAAMGFGGGWPLTVFLTPDKKPFYGGSYFPLEEGYGRPGFKAILVTLSNLYREKKGEIDAHSEKLFDMLKSGPWRAGEIRESAVDEGVRLILAGYDDRHGGFGEAPKFSMSGALEFLINRFFLTRDKFLGEAVRKTLFEMAKGGIHDQLGGGFHRYSTDEEWIIPHFEKMTDDNAWLLRNYTDGYGIFHEPRFKEVATGIVRYLLTDLSDPVGGFYASQDADVSPGDEGGFFTWTDGELKSVLDETEYRVLSLHFFDEKGRMRHDGSKRVLFIAKSVTEIVGETGLGAPLVGEIIERGKKKLLESRNIRPAPFIDNALYTSLNGLAISAFLKAYRILGLDEAKEFALKSIDRVEKRNISKGRLLHSEGIPALLDDYVFFCDALIAAYEVTGRAGYLDRAGNLMDVCLGEFGDESEGGFFDTAEEVAGMRLKGIEDIPHPSANAMAISQLMKLSFMSGLPKYRAAAMRALESFAGNAQSMGVHGASFLSALDGYFNTWELTCNLSPEADFARAALSLFHPYTAVRYGRDEGTITSCRKEVCFEPVRSVEELGRLMAPEDRGSPG
jgi:uncharacterized protein